MGRDIICEEDSVGWHSGQAGSSVENGEIWLQRMEFAAQRVTPKSFLKNRVMMTTPLKMDGTGVGKYPQRPAGCLKLGNDWQHRKIEPENVVSGRGERILVNLLSQQIAILLIELIGRDVTQFKLSLQARREEDFPHAIRGDTRDLGHLTAHSVIVEIDDDTSQIKVDEFNTVTHVFAVLENSSRTPSRQCNQFEAIAAGFDSAFFSGMVTLASLPDRDYNHATKNWLRWFVNPSKVAKGLVVVKGLRQVVVRKLLNLPADCEVL